MLAAALRVFALARWLVVLEIGIWRSLFLWVTRRVPGRGPSSAVFPYAREVTPVVLAFTFVSAIELPVVHLLLPWEPLRLAALGLGVWGLLWMVGYLASMRVFPHLVDDDGLRIRQGTRVDIRVPWEAVAEVTARRGRADTRSVLVEEGDDGVVAHVAMLKQTRVAIALRAPTPLRLPAGTREVVELRLYADDPRGFVDAARERLRRHRSPEAVATGARSAEA